MKTAGKIALVLSFVLVSSSQAAHLCVAQCGHVDGLVESPDLSLRTVFATGATATEAFDDLKRTCPKTTRSGLISVVRTQHFYYTSVEATEAEVCHEIRL